MKIKHSDGMIRIQQYKNNSTAYILDICSYLRYSESSSEPSNNVRFMNILSEHKSSHSYCLGGDFYGN